jgi:zinc protease
MYLTKTRAARVLALVTATILAGSAPANAGPVSAPEFKVPVEYYKLPNGLRVVLSPDHTSPIICVGVY